MFRLLSFISLITLISCDRVELPRVVTIPVSALSWESMTAGGEIIDEGGAPVTARGICVTIYPQKPLTPTFEPRSHWFTTDGTGSGIFTSYSHFLYSRDGHPHTHYYRAYATNKFGTSYGELIKVDPASKPPKFESIKIKEVYSTEVKVNVVFCDDYDYFFTVDDFYFCYGPDADPTIDGPHCIAIKDTDGLSYTIKDFKPSTTYHLRGYISNESGFAYSPDVTFTTWEGMMYDREGNAYPSKTIGNQVWMAKNLAATKYDDDTDISKFDGKTYWETFTDGALHYSLEDKNGNLYNFYAVSNSRKLCPSGWHVPSDSEWKQLEMHLGMTQANADLFDYRGTDEGGKLKIPNVPPPRYGPLPTGNAWSYPNTGATNSSEFNAAAAGYVDYFGYYNGYGSYTGFWTSTETGSAKAIGRELSSTSSQIRRMESQKEYGFSVRCVKD